MSINDIRRLFAPLALVAMVAACGGADDAATDGREIELTPSAAEEPLNDAPETGAQPAPATSGATPSPTTTPRPAAPASRPPAAATSGTGVVAAGTSFAVNNTARICTNTHKVGDRFTTTLAADVMGTNGTRIPAGATVTLTVTESAISKNSKDNWKLAFDVVSVTINGETLNVEGAVTNVATIEAVRSQSTAQQAGKVATGAAIGAVAGQLLGKDTKSTVVGAAAGAVAGGAVAAATTDYEGCLPENGTITIALGAPLTLRRTN
jgi:hypothetical protein